MNNFIKRAQRVRRAIKKSGRIRLSVFKSNKNIYAQIINDDLSTTLVSVSTLTSDLKSLNKNKDSARQIGHLIAKKAVNLGIEEVVFDRGGYKYHGVIQSLAEGARESGLKF